MADTRQVVRRAGEPTGAAAQELLSEDARRLTREIAGRPAPDAGATRLLEVTAAIADAISSEEVFEAVVDDVASAVEASSAALWLVDEQAGVARLARARGYAASAEQRLQVLPLNQYAIVPVLDAIRRCEPIWISSQEALLEQYPQAASVATTGRQYRVSCLPLISHGRVVGALGLTNEQPREVTEREKDFLLLVARYASQAVERLRLYEAERRSRFEADAAAARLRLLGRVSRAFIEADLDLETRLRSIACELGSTLQSCVGISLLEADGLLRTVALYHADPAAAELLRSVSTQAPLAMGEGLSGRVAETGNSVFIPSLDAQELAARAAPAYRDYLEHHPVYALICAPLRSGRGIIGTVTATRTNRGESYTGDDLQLVEELAERAGVAIENSRLYQETLESQRRAEQLYRFAKAVVAADRIETIFEAALDAIEAALGVKRAAVLTFDGAGVMRFDAWRKLSDEYRRAVEGHSPWTRDATAPEPVLVSDAEQDPELQDFHPLFRREQIGALAFIPLVTRGRLLGKFMLYYEQPHAFSSQELGTARALANHLAAMIARFATLNELEKTVRYNELFAGVLAHDLRTPLGAIMMGAQHLLMRLEGQSGRDGGDRKPISRILASGQRMTTMIDQLLDFTRARSGGGFDVQPRPTNLAELCAQAVQELELAHPEWRIMRKESGELGGTWDPDRLLQVISNLVANAAQHGDEGGTVVLRLDGGRPAQVRLEVHNKGAIPPSLLPQLFDPFRSTRHRRDHSRGLGLGLFIARGIVRAHDGEIGVASAEPQGTTFSIVLPRHSTRPPDAPRVRARRWT